jgi:hypothetical protein
MLKIFLITIFISTYEEVPKSLEKKHIRKQKTNTQDQYL